MYHVLVALDEDESRARAQAAAVTELPAADDEVRATLFHAFTDNPRGASATQVAGVRRAREALDAAGVEVDVVETSGDPAEEILDAARDRDADAICVGGRKRSPAGKALFGSVVQSVVLNADRPVIVAGEREEK
ncbi:universal stress protein [halophilic archaeon]|nr:universal stress protein [halophilic archaeon]